MPRRDDIHYAFHKAIKVEITGRRTVTTEDFQRELAAVNWHWSLHQANKWIEHYVTTFKDISTTEGERRTFMLFSY